MKKRKQEPATTDLGDVPKPFHGCEQTARSTLKRQVKRQQQTAQDSTLLGHRWENGMSECLLMKAMNEEAVSAHRKTT